MTLKKIFTALCLGAAMMTAQAARADEATPVPCAGPTSIVPSAEDFGIIDEPATVNPTDRVIVYMQTEFGEATANTPAEQVQSGDFGAIRAPLQPEIFFNGGAVLINNRTGASCPISDESFNTLKALPGATSKVVQIPGPL